MSVLPPGPWDWVTSKIPGGNGSFHIYIVDGNGRKIAALYGKAEERIAVAQFVVEEMNSRTKDVNAVKAWVAQPVHEDEVF